MLQHPLTRAMNNLSRARPPFFRFTQHESGRKLDMHDGVSGPVRSQLPRQFYQKSYTLPKKKFLSHLLVFEIRTNYFIRWIFPILTSFFLPPPSSLCAAAAPWACPLARVLASAHTSTCLPCAACCCSPPLAPAARAAAALLLLRCCC